MIDDKILQEVHDNWKRKGFPYYPKDKIWRDNIFNQLINFKRDILIDRDKKVIGQAAHGLNLAWSYMEHSWGIKCGKMKTPKEVWNDEEHLKKGINKILSGTFFTVKSSSTTKSDLAVSQGSEISKDRFQNKVTGITESDMRSMLRRYSGTQMVSNFRPTAAAVMYDLFVDKGSILEGTEAGTVWDPSMGYGGRLLGAISAGVNYIGTDPCIPTFKGLEKIKDDYGHKDRSYTLLKQGSETYIPEDNSLDFVFTSPPYFGWEAYGDEPEQSSIKFNNAELWKEKFLKQTIANAYKGLKQNKYLALNVANTKQYKTFEEDTVDLAKQVGFTYADTWWLSLSTQQGGSKKSNLDKHGVEVTKKIEDPKQKQQYMGEHQRPDVAGRKFEPVFIFKKC